MTNEEKAREIENGIVHRENQPIYYMAIREAAEEMAEWKDKQFKEYLEKENIKVSSINPEGEYGMGFQDGIDYILDKIINELF